nr:hypothetical protein [Tanacetum cinerariifolium]
HHFVGDVAGENEQERARAHGCKCPDEAADYRVAGRPDKKRAEAGPPPVQPARAA